MTLCQLIGGHSFFLKLNLMTQKKPKSFRFNDILLEQISDFENSLTESIEFAIETVLLQRKMAIRGLKGKFNREEIISIADIYNGIIFEKSWMGSKTAMIAELEDAEKFDSISSRHQVDLNALIEKINCLNDNEVFYLNYEIYRFWNVENAYGSPSPDLEKLIDFLC